MRESWDDFFLRQALNWSTRGTCVRRQVGAVAVNAHRYVLATAFNGVPAGFPHCDTGHKCPGAGAPSGVDLDQCLAVHAEVNLLAQCHDVWEIDTVYLTVSPCFFCVKALVTSGCRRIVFNKEYSHPHARIVWEKAGRIWEKRDLV